MKWKWTSFLGTAGSIKLIQSTAFKSKHFINRARYSNSIYSQNEVTLSPVAFEDAGEYQLLDYGKTINLITIQDSVGDDLPKELQIGHFFLISCIFILFLTLIVFCIFQKLQTLGGENMEVHTNVPLSADVQYTSVRFYKKPTEFQKTSVINHNQDYDSEVVYTVIHKNE
ncbi:uncharacterized protein ACMZJ9_004951 [Mantella aurantiaca]